MAARRLPPDTLGAIDLRVADPRVVWARKARASSEYSSSYAAREACGPPRVFPEGGDERHTWLAANGDRDPWIELDMPPVDAPACALIVCETCGPGAVKKIRDLERDVVLFERAPEKIRPSREARLLHVPLDGPAPSKLRLEVAPYAFGSEYKEIDAVGLLLAPLEELIERGLGAGAHRRYPPSAVQHLDLRGDPRIHWAKRARASSEYSSGYAARHAIGPPRVFPRGGDLERTWLASDRDTEEWLEVEHDVDGLVHGVMILETCGAGSVCTIHDEEGRLLWSAAPQKVPERKARLLHVELDAIASPKKLRIGLAPGDDYRQIDAVALLTAPFDTLDEPPPAPGTPAEGWEALEGTLIAQAPFVHAVLSTAKAARAANHGPAPTLRLPSGDEVKLDTGRTAIVGAPLRRVRGTWARCREEAPRLAAAFADDPPADDEEVELGGRVIEGEVAAEVIGDASGMRATGGFRDAARAVPERIEAAAICVGDRGAFDQLGADLFDREAERLRPRETAPHPLRSWEVGLAVAALLGLAAIVVQWARTGSAWAEGGSLLFAPTFFFGIHALELWARRSRVPAFLRRPGSGLHDRRVPFARPLFDVFAGAAVLALAVPLAAVPLALLVEGEGVERRLVALGVGLYAIFRAVMWARDAARDLPEALRVARAPAILAKEGARGRLSGLLGAGELGRKERYVARSKHLGTYTTTDADGKVVTQDSWRHWNERIITARAPGIVSLFLPTGERVRVQGSARSTDLGLETRPRSVDELGHFESRHREGDPATVVGTVVGGEGAEVVVEATHLVLGELGALRRRAAVQVFVLFVLGAIGVGGLALALT